MSTTRFLDGIMKPVIILGALLTVTTVISYLTGPRGEEWTKMETALWMFDFRHERNIASWFSGQLFFLCGIAFSVIGWDPVITGLLPVRSVITARSCAIAGFFFSVDEMISLHERFGTAFEKLTGFLANSPIAEYGFSWVLLYGPFCLIGIVLLLELYFNLYRRLQVTPATIRKIYRWLAVGLVGVPLVLIFELLEGMTLWMGAKTTPLPCIEESIEFLTLVGFIKVNVMFAECPRHNLR